MHKIFAGCFVISLAVIAGCTNRIVDFTMISTKNLDLDRIGEYQRSDQRVEGKDKKHIIIFIPTGTPSAEEAVDQAIESVPGAVALLDGVLRSEWFWFPYIYGYSTYVVSGTALIDPQLVSDKPDNSSAHGLVVINEKGKVEKSEDLSKAEYHQYLDAIEKNEPLTEGS